MWIFNPPLLGHQSQALTICPISWMREGSWLMGGILPSNKPGFLADSSKNWMASLRREHNLDIWLINITSHSLIWMPQKHPPRVFGGRGWTGDGINLGVVLVVVDDVVVVDDDDDDCKWVISSITWCIRIHVSFTLVLFSTQQALDHLPPVSGDFWWFGQTSTTRTVLQQGERRSTSWYVWIVWSKKIWRFIPKNPCM